MAQATRKNIKVVTKSKSQGAAKQKPKIRPRPIVTTGRQAARKLERVSRKFDASVEMLRDNLIVVGDCLYELLAAEAGQECRRRFSLLAEAGVLHDLQALAAAFERISTEALPPALNGVERYAAIAIGQLQRVFEVQPIHQPGEEITVSEAQQEDAFDWSADTRRERAFPLQARVLRSGWKRGSEVLVKPKLSRPNSE
jgi:hypothetical protein